MRINWVVANQASIQNKSTVDDMKAVGPIWGGHQTWRHFRTDNVICHDLAMIRKLMGRALHAVCNFYAPKKHYADLGRPASLQFYDGDFQHDVTDPEDIIAMHLTAANSDIVLLYGFEMAIAAEINDRMEQHRVVNYHGLMRSAIATNPDVQWVLVDPQTKPDPVYLALPNFNCERMKNVLKLI